jgi:hypothetical protein
VCNSTGGACDYTSCSEDKTLTNPCKTVALTCGVPIDNTETIVVAAAAASSAALIAGIICAVVVLGGVVGGATVAVYSGGNDDGMTNTSNNPLYSESGNSGSNPLSMQV